MADSKEAGGTGKAKIERQRWAAEKLVREREEAERRRIKAEKDSSEELSSTIRAWAETKIVI
jgi:hypothetical protein